eukprot:Gb_38450 [translate_table: standard]
METESFPSSKRDCARKLHVVMLPYLAHGHVNPMAELAKGLSALGVQVSFVSTPMYIDQIRDRFPRGEIQLVELALPPMEGLPPGHESTSNLPPHLTPLFKQAVREMEKPFESLLRQLSPDCVIHDMLMHWMSIHIKRRLNIPTVVFIASSVVGIASIMKSLENTVDDSPACRSPATTVFQGLRNFLITCVDVIVANSCEEMESKFISYVQASTGTCIFPVGPLTLSSPPTANGELGESDKCIQWLERRAPSSVVFVSLGSECFPSKDELHAIALGLEASQHPFLWVLRFPKYSEEDYSSDAQILDASSSLPPGFESRTCDRGLLVDGWANQTQILSHPSTGAFMTHCGWNSSMEGMSAGIPLIALPMQYDQTFNARLIAEELKVGVEVEKGSNASFTKEQIQKAVTNAMVHDSPVRHNAKLFGETIQKNVFGTQGSSKKCLIEFVQKLKQMTAFNA